MRKQRKVIGWFLFSVGILTGCYVISDIALFILASVKLGMTFQWSLIWDLPISLCTIVLLWAGWGFSHGWWQNMLSELDFK